MSDSGIKARLTSVLSRIDDAFQNRAKVSNMQLIIL